MSAKSMHCPYCCIPIDNKVCFRCKRDCTVDDLEVVHQPYNAKHKEKERRCTRCRKFFKSSWSGDRTCPPCKEKKEPYPVTSGNLVIPENL